LDKEIFWFGLELCQVPYHFAKHYGIAFGPLSDGDSVVVVHMDAVNRLLWFNGEVARILVTTFSTDTGYHRVIPPASAARIRASY